MTYHELVQLLGAITREEAQQKVVMFVGGGEPSLAFVQSIEPAARLIKDFPMLEGHLRPEQVMLMSVRRRS